MKRNESTKRADLFGWGTGWLAGLIGLPFEPTADVDWKEGYLEATAVKRLETNAALTAPKTEIRAN